MTASSTRPAGSPVPAADTGDKQQCPVHRCAEVVAGKWTLLVIRDLACGPQYFGDLERSLVGISPRTLCHRLKFLVERGVATRTRIRAVPPRTVYELTEHGRALLPVVEAMRMAGVALAAGCASPPATGSAAAPAPGQAT